MTNDAITGIAGSDWDANLKEFLLDSKDGLGVKDQTHANYKNWLTPWVNHIQGQGSHITSVMIRKYLNMRYTSHSSHKRIGKAIVLFTSYF